MRAMIMLAVPALLAACGSAGDGGNESSAPPAANATAIAHRPNELRRVWNKDRTVVSLPTLPVDGNVERTRCLQCRIRSALIEP